jgi:N utilization substance protein B
MRLRSLAREYTLQLLYQIEIGGYSPEESADDFFANHCPELPKQVRQFVMFIANGVREHREELDGLIAKYARNWDVTRMAVVDRNIMRMGIYEILFVVDIPPKVSINEAVELAKKFGDVESAKFVNGILDGVFRNESAARKTLTSPA